MAGTLRIFSTGVRSGEQITSAPGAKQNAGTVAIVRGLYPPSEKGVAELDDTTLRDAFNHYPFFAAMTVDERRQWLEENATSNNDLYMEDVPGLALRFVKIGGKFFTESLTQEQLDMLLAGNPDDSEGFWPIQTVYNMFPRKPGSRARKHTLIFRPNNWVLMTGQAAVESFNGMCFDLDTLTLNYGQVRKPAGGYMRTFKAERLAQLLPEYAVVTSRVRKNLLTWEHLLSLAPDYAAEMRRVRPLLEWFPPALFKSLIQKLIRTRCKSVEYAGVEYPAGAVLLAAISMLMLHSGSFVPNIQRFVSGMESAAKRLAVSICEDSYVEDSRFVALLYMCAAIAQHDRTWQPTDEVIMWWFRAALLAQQDPRMYDYDWHTFTGVKEWNMLSFSYFLLGEIRSFQSDIDMVGSIAERGGRYRQPIQEIELMPVMPLIHCIDHHTFTEIGHYMPYTGEPYSEVFKRIWNVKVGMNPRNVKYAKWSQDSPEVKDVARAQRELWISKIHTPTPRAEGKGEVKFNYDLDPSWIAGLIGPIEVRVSSGTAIVVLRTDNIFEYTAIKRPSREKGAPELTEEEKLYAISAARQNLQQGIRLENVPTTLPQFIGATVFLRGTEAEGLEYYLRLASAPPTPVKPLPPSSAVKPLPAPGTPFKAPAVPGLVKWSEAVHLSYTFPVHPAVTPSVEEALLYTGNGVMEGADATFDGIVRGTSASILRRMMTYLEGSRTYIELHKISRDGSGVEYAVLPEDTGVHTLLSYICVLYPAAMMKTPTGFQVKNGPLLWSLRDKLMTALRGEKKAGRQPVWKVPAPDERKMWEHQLDIRQTMRTRHLQGKRSNLLWVPVGLGKSMNITDDIHWLIETGDMPDYCVWTLPPSAADSIRRELDFAHLPHQTIDMRSGSRIQTLTAGMVNIVFHDHMRLGNLSEQLKTHAPNMYFIVDEFHKTMAHTIRTSIALDVARLARYLAGLSGTIVRDTDVSGSLIPWLEQVVEFEVTEKNYWVAVGALISRRVMTKVVVERTMAEAKLLNPSRYYSMVPQGLGGTASHLDFKGALTECYNAVTEELIRQAVAYIQLGEPVFIVAKDVAHQELLRDRLAQEGIRQVHLITKDTPITLTPEDQRPIQAVITTGRHAEGYTLTKIRVGITGVYFSNEATRQQLEGRLNRIGQPSPVVRWIIAHAGLLTYILKRYEAARSLAEALRGFARDIGLEGESMVELRAQL